MGACLAGVQWPGVGAYRDGDGDGDEFVLAFDLCPGSAPTRSTSTWNATSPHDEGPPPGSGGGLVGSDPG
jgi:hypothetical protein